ncbi:MAG TPA: hypothetical protein PK668_08520 [Myxococcota bacterium]|nr:hypothetical protein [Myxococcota bacterium]HRY92979.1 hypothetical protein [Myxococcota bacterium]HSA19912.1 hypothetical protein [Myxococcota bacterium]
MPDCERLATCPFFNDRMSKMPAMADLVKEHYCRQHFDQCARYRVMKALGPNLVPRDLYPSQHERVDLMLKPKG